MKPKSQSIKIFCFYDRTTRTEIKVAANCLIMAKAILKGRANYCELTGDRELPGIVVEETNPDPISEALPYNPYLCYAP